MITQRDFRLPMINENDLKEENEIIKNNLYYKLKLQKKFSDKNHLISNSLLLPKINSSFKKQTIDSYRKRKIHLKLMIIKIIFILLELKEKLLNLILLK